MKPISHGEWILIYFCIFFVFTCVSTLVVVIIGLKHDDRITAKIDKFLQAQDRLIDHQEKISTNTYHISRILDMFARDTDFMKSFKQQKESRNE